jgi:hypothetical protein
MVLAYVQRRTGRGGGVEQGAKERLWNHRPPFHAPFHSFCCIRCVCALRNPCQDVGGRRPQTVRFSTCKSADTILPRDTVGSHGSTSREREWRRDPVYADRDRDRARDPDQLQRGVDLRLPAPSRTMDAGPKIARTRTTSHAIIPPIAIANARARSYSVASQGHLAPTECKYAATES